MVSDRKNLPPASITDALAFSRNFANSNPNLSMTAKEHILGLASLLERAAAPQPDTVAEQNGLMMDVAEAVYRYATGRRAMPRDELKAILAEVMGQAPAQPDPVAVERDEHWAFQMYLSNKGIAANYQGGGQYSGESRDLKDAWDAGAQWRALLEREK